MQMEHAHYAETGSCIGDGLGVTPDPGHHFEQCLDIVADGLEPRDIITAQVSSTVERVVLALPERGKLITSPIGGLHLIIAGICGQRTIFTLK